jgi:hypothetical protein
MAFSLYDASVANYLQTLGAVTGFLDRGLSHCKEKGVNPEEIVRGAIEAVQKGVFLPFGGAPDLKYAALPSDGDRSARRAVGHDAGRGQYADRPRRRVPSRRA